VATKPSCSILEVAIYKYAGSVGSGPPTFKHPSVCRLLKKAMKSANWIAAQLAFGLKSIDRSTGFHER
jgi:hypothetical protein